MTNLIHSPSDSLSNQPIFSVADLSNAVKRAIESNFEFVRVRGEISKPAFPDSGHIYFSLKDANVTLASVIWKRQLSHINIQPEEGMDVICTGKLTTFSGQSRYQLNVAQIEFSGEGALLKQLEALRQRLQAEGLFSEDCKQKIPYLPSVLGVVTSPTGAVIRDILYQLSERFGTRVLIAPVPVQGRGAEQHIANAVKAFNQMREDGQVPKPDLIIVARGGGSLEDLWCFNEEIVVRAVFESKIAVISAVGHETDTTLIDYVSDRRAPTPTAAAEIATPILTELVARISELNSRTIRALDRKFNFKENQLTAAFRGLTHPSDQINQLSQRIDIVNEKIEKNFQHMLSSKQHNLASLFQRLPTPINKLGNIETRIIAANERMRAQIDKKLLNSEQTILRYEQLLNALSFKRVLEKGFVLVTDLDGNPIKESQDAPSCAHVNLEFFDAKRHAQLDPEKISGSSKKAQKASQKQTQNKKEVGDDTGIRTQPKLF